MPVLRLSRESSAVRLELVRPFIQRFLRPSSHPVPTPTVGVERDASPSSAVPRVPCWIKLAQVPNRVALVVVVDVVNYFRRLLSVVEKPDHSVSVIVHPLVPDAVVTEAIGISDRGSSFDAPSVVNRPPKLSGVWIKIQQFVKFLWDNLSIHSVLPHVVARGPVVGATGYPRFYHDLGGYY